MNRTIPVFLLIILLGFISCQENPVCERFIHEEYREQPVNDTLWQEAMTYRDSLMKWLEERPIKDSAYTAYHIQYYSSFRLGQSIKIQKSETSYLLEFKYFARSNNEPTRKNYNAELSEEEWNTLERMLYEFDFWTEADIVRPAPYQVLDGDIIFIEGVRPEAANCNKKTYQLIGRASPVYDKMGSLANMIMDYEKYRLAPEESLLQDF